MKVKSTERSQKFKFPLHSRMKRNVLIYLLIAIIILGTFFRFTNLATKVYWGDETVTSLRVSGYTIAQIKERASQGQALSVAELQKYQYPSPDKNIWHTIKGLAAEEPQHPPLYYVMVKLWVQLFGNSIAVTRSFSAVLSLLALPCMYWLCQELFNSPLTGGIAVALVAVSPLHILYAQEARSYSFWTVTILLSCAALLRARRLQTSASWTTYALTLAIAFYTFALSAVIAIAHGIYLFINEGYKLTKTVRTYLISVIATLICFLPWVFAVLQNFSEADSTTSWTKIKVPLKDLFKNWLLNLSRPFVDFNYNFARQNLFLYGIILLLVILVGYAIYFLCRHTQQRVWLFILSLIGLTAAIVIVPDLLFGGIRSSVTRYLIPCVLGMQIAVAYLLASGITSVLASAWQRQLWRIAAVVLLSLSIASCAASAQAQVWWNKYNAVTLPAVANIVNQATNPIFITSWHGLMAFSHVLAPEVRLQPLERQPIAIAKTAKADVFVYNSTKTLKTLTDQENGYRIERAYEWQTQVEPVYKTETKLWKLSK
jgi:uncharacterized membrane protein